MSSIRQKPSIPDAFHLPDFTNQGIWLRALATINFLMILVALAANQQWGNLPEELLILTGQVEPPLIATLLILAMLNSALNRLPTIPAFAIAIGLAMATGILSYQFSLSLRGIPANSGSLWRALLWSALAASAVLAHLGMRQHRQSPAIAEARLMALTARIRPHFLFNSLNAVLGVIRTEPRRAEEALESLSDLFRALMQEHRDLVPLSGEMALARQYLALERLRLGDRLCVRWDIDTCPPDARMPPLMIQPLLENAVYHGIEPLGGPGEITISFVRHDKILRIEISNPCLSQTNHHASHGNQMALANIRERLMLFYDLEARLETRNDAGRYTVRIDLPYRHVVKP